MPGEREERLVKVRIVVDDDLPAAAAFAVGSTEEGAAEITVNLAFHAEPGPREQLMVAVAAELEHAYRKHGRDPWGRHEFFAILLEEVDELKEAVWKDAPQEEVLAELRQVAAMCFRYVETGDRYRGAHPPVPTRARGGQNAHHKGGQDE